MEEGNPMAILTITLHGAEGKAIVNVSYRVCPNPQNETIDNLKQVYVRKLTRPAIFDIKKPNLD